MIARALTVAVAFLVAIIALCPLRVAWSLSLQGAGLSAASVDGTVWVGRVSGLVWRGQTLGSFDTSLSPADLLPQPAIRLANGSGPLRAARVRAPGGVLEIADADIRLPLTAVAPVLDAGDIVRISGASLVMRGRTCVSASGRLDAPAIPALGLPAITGTLGCEGGVLLARLASKAGAAVLAIDNLSAPSLGWRSAPASLAAVFATLGIHPSAPSGTAAARHMGD